MQHLLRTGSRKHNLVMDFPHFSLEALIIKLQYWLSGFCITWDLSTAPTSVNSENRDNPVGRNAQFRSFSSRQPLWGRLEQLRAESIQTGKEHSMTAGWNSSFCRHVSRPCRHRTPPRRLCPSLCFAPFLPGMHSDCFDARQQHSEFAFNYGLDGGGAV